MEGPTEKLPPHNLSTEDDEDGNGSIKGIVVATLKVGVLYIILLKLIFHLFLATEMEFGLRLGDSVGSHGIASSCDTDMRP